MSRGLSSAAWGRIKKRPPPDPCRFLRPEGGTLNLSGAHAGGCAPLRVEGAGRAQAEQMARERADTVLVLDCPVTDCALVGIQVFQNEDFIEEGGSRESGCLAVEYHRHNIVHRIPVAKVGNDLTLCPFRAPDCEFAAALKDVPVRLSCGPSHSGKILPRRDYLVVTRRYARAACRVRQLPPAMGSGHSPDHASAVPQEPAQDRLLSGFELKRAGMRARIFHICGVLHLRR